MQHCLFIGGPKDGQTIEVDPPRTYLFRADDSRIIGQYARDTTDSPQLLWRYDAHRMKIGDELVEVYVVEGMNMRVAYEEFLYAMNARTR